jgi:zinc-binding alcohol dehydrogenase family protein
MKAFGYLSANSAASELDLRLYAPQGNDLLVQIDAIAVNPVDTKVKGSIEGTLMEPKVVGWDAAGTVVDVGPLCTRFKVGDKVFYAGDITRQGSYATHQLVDERIVGKAPQTLSPIESAAMPLTSITAWEALFSRMKLRFDQDQFKTLLIIGGAGGVGSIAIQLAKKLLNMTVVATASRPESVSWCQQMGADYVINHYQLRSAYDELMISAPDYILCLNETDIYYYDAVNLIAPQGLICFVTTSYQEKNIDLLKNKSAGIVWEFMFTRPMYITPDMDTQHQILNQVASLIDEGVLKSTLTQNLGQLSPYSLAQAHDMLLSGQTIGKIGLTVSE